jgi:hypothetical protein
MTPPSVAIARTNLSGVIGVVALCTLIIIAL